MMVSLCHGNQGMQTNTEFAAYVNQGFWNYAFFPSKLCALFVELCTKNPEVYELCNRFSKNF